MSDVLTRFQELLEKCKQDVEPEDMLHTLQSSINSFPDYVSSVVYMTTNTPIIRATCEGEDLKDKIMKLDDRRRTCHESAIRSCQVLNRMCEMYQLQPFFTGDIGDRYAVADFCVEVVNEFYKEEISRSRYQTIDEMCVDDFRPERKTIEEFETVVAHQEEPVMEEDELER